MNVVGPHYDMKLFAYDRVERILTAYVSDLVHGGRDCFGQLFDDACDVGLVVDSPFTGRSVAFSIARTDRDNDGDIAGWYLNPYRPTGTEVGLRMLVIND